MLKPKSAAIAAVITAAFLAFTSPANAHEITSKDCYRAAQKLSTIERPLFIRVCIKKAKLHNLQHYCQGPLRTVPKAVTVKGRHASRHQRYVLTTALNIARKRDVSYKVNIALIATLTQESSANELRGGHGTSAGPLQLIDTHGTAKQRQSTAFSTNWFLDAAINIDHHYPSISATELSHRVQRSAHPNAVAKWMPEARQTYRLYVGECRGIR